ncbi:MAG: hypothetical protein BWY80_00859 [Firmicutes bacterium ADurb.Bin456]|nr:MAG: hypothetical protein BWY80_00859 [Firmicutes bacterium ADurb.Bin456]
MLYKVNMLPVKLQREGLIDVKRLIVISVLTLFLTLTLGSYGAFLINYNLMKNDLKDTATQLDTLAPLVARVERIQRERMDLEAAMQEYEEILQNQKAWSVLLGDLSGVTPIDIWLVELAIENKPVEKKTPPTNAPSSSQSDTGNPKGQGERETAGLPHPNSIVLKGYSRMVPSVGVFVQNLNYLPYFNEVKLNRVNLDDQGYLFEIITILEDEV